VLGALQRAPCCAREMEMPLVQVDCGEGRDFRDRVCVADEHYVPSLLSVYKQDEARCSYSGLTYSFFAPDAHHPKTFQSGTLRTALQDMKCRNWIGYASMQYTGLWSAAT
jgi:hypothetical protein